MTQMPPEEEPFTLSELQRATRSRGMPLEALRHDITPTGLHFLLLHFDMPAVDLAEWRLDIGGNVERPLSLSLDDLAALPARTTTVTMECAGNGRARMPNRVKTQPWLLEAVSTAEWTGTPLAGVLEEVGVQAGTVEFVFTGADRGIQGEAEHDYERSLTLADAMRPEVLLAYAMNGQPLEPQHGAPLRLVVPGWYGMTSVKWLRRIAAVKKPFDGYQQAKAYRIQTDEDDAGVRVSHMKVRALMAPPGIYEFPTGHRHVDPGPVLLHGRAWCGEAPVAEVHVGVDGRWERATLGPKLGPFAWRSWSWTWKAEPGEHVLSCRATDANGNAQPLEPVWNLQGMCNNYIQTVPVTVRRGK
jgi:DMSO/TMAO reductase YedYZ molybdopterin-dependent catalytic subunit